ncbi:cytochrome P450 3A24 [Trichonephila clavipes]|nr:cytochrome P450 3A24 [Trichonephila clavipes]
MSPQKTAEALNSNFHLVDHRRTFCYIHSFSDSLVEVMNEMCQGLKTGDTITESMLQLLEGEDWKRVRAIVTPTFTTGKIKRMMDIFTSCSKVLVDNFRKVAEKGESVDAKKIYGAFTMDIIASAAFSTKLDSHNDPNNEFVRVARNVFHKNVNYRFIFYLLFPRIMRLFRVPIFPPEGVKFFTDVTLRIIEERKRTGQKRNDFLQLLLDTAEEQKIEDKSSEKSDEILNNYESEMNDQVFKNFHSKKMYFQVDDHVHPGNCPAAVSSEKKRPSSYGVLPSPAELGYERTDVVFFFIF